MGTIVSKLTPKDKKALAHFFETDAYSALKKLMSLAKANAAEKALKAFDFNEVKHLQGQNHALEALEETLEKVYKLDQKS